MPMRNINPSVISKKLMLHFSSNHENWSH